MQKLNRRTFIKTTSAAGAALFSNMSLNSLYGTTGAKKPNLLLIMTDQQRFDAIGRVQADLEHYKGKLHVRTPNLDKLSRDGAYFKRTYTHCAVCAPVRNVIRTGCTIERSGVQANGLMEEKNYKLIDIFKDKVEKMETFDHVLVEDLGYTAEYYGKWHMPKIFKQKRDGSSQLYRYNAYDWKENKPVFKLQKHGYKHELEPFKDILSKECKNGQQYNTYGGYPYDPIKLDKRYGKPSGWKHPKKDENGKRYRISQPEIIGRDTLGEKFTPSYFEGTAALKALERLTKEDNPFVLTCSFHNPHAPFVATGKYYDYYWKNREKIYVPESIESYNDNNFYVKKSSHLDKNHPMRDPKNIQEWSVPYYALCEEIDVYVGKLLDHLEKSGKADDTMVIFLSDHGEMLGSHGMGSKNKFMEESSRVPLFIKFPGRIKPKTIVDTPISTLDIYATILDYMGGSQYDIGDGKSLRRFIDLTNYNAEYDEEAIVTEWDFREPTKDGSKLQRSLGHECNFLVVKDNWKLMMTKKRTSRKVDMAFNLEKDPFEMNNLIGKVGLKADDKTINKVEHLKALLLDWMKRMDGPDKLYSNPKYNMGEGEGDILEIAKRIKWKKVPVWISHKKLSIGPLAKVPGKDYFQRNEYVYLGRTLSGKLKVKKVTISGPDASKIELSEFTKGSIKVGEYKRIKLSLKSDTREKQTLKAKLKISHSEGSDTIALS